MTPPCSDEQTATRLVLAVRLGREAYAFPIDAVEEVLPALPIEAVPQCPKFVRGVVFVRGRLIPVLDAAERLGVEGHVREAEPHIVCLRVSGRIVGVEVDEALDLMESDPSEMIPAAEIGATGGVLNGVVDQDGFLLRLLNPGKLLCREEQAALDAAPLLAST